MINRVVLMGRLVAYPELKTTNTGVSVTSFRIAVDRSYVKAGAERQADFFDIVAWRSSAEFVCRNFSKGSLIAVSGHLQSRQYQTKDGENRTVIEVVADNVSFTGERRDSANGGRNTAVSGENRQCGNFNDKPKNAYTAQNKEYQVAVNNPQRFAGAYYDPRSDQGQLDGGYRGGYTPDDDLPWN